MTEREQHLCRVVAYFFSRRHSPAYRAFTRNALRDLHDERGNPPSRCSLR